MKQFPFIVALCMLVHSLSAQSTQNNLVEGGRLLVELVKIFKKSAPGTGLQDQNNATADLCFSNTSTDSLVVEVFKKINDTSYKLLPVSLHLPGISQECLLSISAAIYHYRISRKQMTGPVLLIEGDLRLNANEKMQREIK